MKIAFIKFGTNGDSKQFQKPFLKTKQFCKALYKDNGQINYALITFIYLYIYIYIYIYIFEEWGGSGTSSMPF